MRDALNVAGPTHQSAVERITSLIRFVGQLHTAVLAHVTVDMKIFVHRDYSHCFLGTLKNGVNDKIRDNYRNEDNHSGNNGYVPECRLSAA